MDHGKLLSNAVEWATNEERPVHGDRAGRARRDRVAAEALADRPPGQPDQPDDDEGPDPRAAIPVGEQKVRVRLPEGKQVARVHLLGPRSMPQVIEQAAGILTVRRAVGSGSRSRGAIRFGA